MKILFYDIKEFELDYLFDKKYWTPICSVVFMFIAIINLINMILKISKIDDKNNKKLYNKYKN